MAKQVKQEGSCSDTKVKMNAIDTELSKIVGQDWLKLELAKFLKGILCDERRRALGLKLGPRKLPHLAFLGNPGTGKSMVARMLGKLLHMFGILKEDKVTEVPHYYLTWYGSELVKLAGGGILLVNYRCVPRFGFDNPDGYKEIEELISFMDNGEVVVIIAGYREKKKFDTGPAWYEGIRNRVSLSKFYFNDCSR